MLKFLLFLTSYQFLSAQAFENQIKVITKKDSYLCKIEYRGKSWDCSIGKNGTGKEKEDDMKTPTGIFKLGDLYYRGDKNGLTERQLRTVRKVSMVFKNENRKRKTIKIKENAAWGGDENNYNQYFEFSEKDPTFINAKSKKLNDIRNNERIWRSDRKYNIILPLNYNEKNILGLGSAIFFHIGRQNPELQSNSLDWTSGCIAMWEYDMFELLNEIGKSKETPEMVIE